MSHLTLHSIDMSLQAP